MIKIILTVLCMFGVVAWNTFVFPLDNVDFWFLEILLFIICGIFIWERINKPYE